MENNRIKPENAIVIPLIAISFLYNYYQHYIVFHHIFGKIDFVHIFEKTLYLIFINYLNNYYDIVIFNGILKSGTQITVHVKVIVVSVACVIATVKLLLNKLYIFTT